MLYTSQNLSNAAHYWTYRIAYYCSKKISKSKFNLCWMRIRYCTIIRLKNRQSTIYLFLWCRGAIRSGNRTKYALWYDTRKEKLIVFVATPFSILSFSIKLEWRCKYYIINSSGFLEAMLIARGVSIPNILQLAWFYQSTV